MKKSNKNIFFIAGSFNALDGGIQRYNKTLLKMLSESNYGLKSISLNDKSEIIENKKVIGFERNLVRFTFYFLRNIFFYDIIIFGHKNFIPLMSFRFLFKSKQIVLIAHGIEIWGSQPEKIKRLSVDIDQIWAVSQFTSKMYRKNFSDHSDIKIIPNVIPDFIKVKEFGEIEHKHNNSEKIKILSVCRLSKSESYKGIDYSIEALNVVFQKTKMNFEFNIIASGDDVDRHIELVNKTDCRNNIFFHSKVSDEKLKEFYESSHIFLLPSSGEGFGIVYLEAIANGCVCIGTNYGGVTDIIQHNVSGLLTDYPVSVKNIADLIETVLTNDSRLNYAKNGLQLLEKFSFLKVKETIQNSLRELVN